MHKRTSITCTHDGVASATMNKAADNPVTTNDVIGHASLSNSSTFTIFLPEGYALHFSSIRPTLNDVRLVTLRHASQRVEIPLRLYMLMEQWPFSVQGKNGSR